ncbi:MAG: META domain-containing protein [Burkholderiaceae bacterium]
MIRLSRLALIATLFAAGGCAGIATSPPDRLIGTWQVVDIAGKPVVPDAPITLVFERDGRLTGHTSCNGFGTQYTIRGDRITIPRPVMTLRACEPERMDQEGRLVTFLDGVTGYRIDGNGTLVLHTAANENLNARPAGAGR